MDRIIAILALLAVIAFGCWRWSIHEQQVGYARAVAEFAAQGRKTDQQRGEVTQAAQTDAVREQERVRIVTKTIVKEVPVYVQANAPDLPAGWRLLHDAAATGSSLPEPAAGIDGIPISAQDAASTVAENYGTCRADQARLSGLQEWVRKQETLNGNVQAP